MDSERFLEEGKLPARENDSNQEPGICDFFLIGVSYLLVVCTFPLSLFFCFKMFQQDESKQQHTSEMNDLNDSFLTHVELKNNKYVVKEYERAVIFRLGRLTKGGARGPGLFFILPCTDNYCNVDLRTVSFNVPPQEVLSKDSVTVSVDAVVYYRVSNATIAISNIANYASSTQLLAATTLRTVLGTKNLSEILAEREHISHVMQASLDEATGPWGVKVERVEIKDVSLPKQMQRAMAAEAEASREARAKVIAAEGEQKASRALKEAADIINESPGALQLRYLQTLTSIAAEKNSTVVFPLPMELLRGLGLK